MDSEVIRGIDLQLFAESEEGQVDTPQESNANTDASTTPASDETSEDDVPLLSEEELERLNEALDKGDFEAFITALGEDVQKKFQSFMDSKITRALQTREKNIMKKLEEQWKKRLEEEKLRAEGKWKELYEMKTREVEEEKKRLEQERIAIRVDAALNAKGLGSEFAKFVRADSIDDVDKAVEELYLLVEAYAQKKIEELQKTYAIPTKTKSANTEELIAAIEQFLPSQETPKKPWEK